MCTCRPRCRRLVLLPVLPNARRSTWRSPSKAPCLAVKSHKCHPVPPPSPPPPSPKRPQEHVAQPFEDVLPYEAFSIRLSNSDLPHLRETLKGLSEEEYRRLLQVGRVCRGGPRVYCHVCAGREQGSTRMVVGTDARLASNPRHAWSALHALPARLLPLGLLQGTLQYAYAFSWNPEISGKAFDYTIASLRRRWVPRPPCCAVLCCAMLALPPPMCAHLPMHACTKETRLSPTLPPPAQAP